MTHAFSETDRAPLAKSAAMAGIPYLDSCQLAGLIDPDYLQREVSRHEDEAREARAKEQLSTFIAHHGGAVVAMFAPEVHPCVCHVVASRAVLTQSLGAPIR